MWRKRLRDEHCWSRSRFRGGERGEGDGGLDAGHHRRRHKRVADGRADRAMAEELLDGPEIDARLEEMRGEGVAERVREDRLHDAGAPAHFAEHVPDRLGRGRLPGPGALEEIRAG